MSDGNPVYQMAGSIGSSQPGLAQYLISNEELLDGLKEYLSKRQDHTASGERIEYTQDCIDWFVAKLSIPLSKTALLSSFNNEFELMDVEWSMYEMFLFDLLSRVNLYHLSDKQILELGQLYLDYTDLALRRAMGKQITDKDLLRGTTSDNRSTVDQNLRSEEKKSGLLPNIFGGGR